MQPQAEQIKGNPQDIPTQAQVQAQPDTQEQINWRKFREVREQERKAAQEQERIATQKTAEAEALKAAMEALLNKPGHSQQNPQYTQTQEMTEDQRIDAAIDARFKQRMQQEEHARMERDRQDAPLRLKRDYKDFDQVCSQSNLDYVEYHYPEVANAFNGRPDSYDKWVDIYKAVKRFVPNGDSTKDAAKAERNFNKPQSMAVPGVSQTGDSAPQALDSKRRADNWARMQKVMKGV